MTAMPAEKTCTPCRGGVPPLSAEEAEAYQAQAPGWSLRDEATRIDRTYRFTNFAEAAAFVQQAAALAESEGHHPDISFGWGYATVSLRTKKKKGCTRMISSWLQSSTALPATRPRNRGP